MKDIYLEEIQNQIFEAKTPRSAIRFMKKYLNSLASDGEGLRFLAKKFKVKHVPLSKATLNDEPELDEEVRNQIEELGDDALLELYQVAKKRYGNLT